LCLSKFVFMKKIYLICLLGLLVGSCSPDHRITQMLESLNQAQYHLQWEAAGSEAARARRFCQQHPKLSKEYALEVALASASLATEHSQFGKARQLLIEADQLLAAPQQLPPRLALLHQVSWGKYYFKKGRPDSAAVLSRKLNDALRQADQAYPEIQFQALQLAGGIYLQLGQVRLAAEAYQEAQAYLPEAGEDLPLQIQSLSSLSFIYGRMGDLLQQESSLKAAESLFQQHPDISPLAKAHYFHNLAKSYQMKAEFRASQLPPEKVDEDVGILLLNNKTIDCLKEAQTWVMQSPSQLDQAIVLMGLGEAQLKYAPEAARELLDSAEAKLIASVGKESYPYFAWLIKRGLAFHVAQDYQASRRYLREAERLGKKMLGAVHPAMGMVHQYLAGSYLWEGRRKGDETLMRKGMKQLDACFAAYSEKILSRDGELRFLGVNEPAGLHTTLRDKGFMYETYPALSADQATAYRNALRYYESAIAVGEEQILGFALHEMQRRALAQVHNYYTQAILLCIRLHELGEGRQYLEQAFALSERSRAFILRLSQKKREALRFASMPDSLPEQEQRLVRQLSRLQALKSTLPSAAEKLVLARKFSQTQQALSQFRKQLQQDHPHYYQWTHELGTQSVRDIQQELAPDEALVAFFAWNISITFAITQDTFLASYEFMPPPDSPYQSPTLLLLEALEEGHAQHDVASYTRYHQRAYDWYQRYLEPVLAPLPRAQKLIIVPDGYALGLPFEILLTEAAPARPSYDPQQLAYLLETHEISYAFSATTYFYPDFLRKEASPSAYPLLAFAPTFEAFNASQVSRLSGCGAAPQTALQATAEVKQLPELFAGKIWEGQAARRATFLREAKKAQRLHLHTHGCADFDNPMGSRLFLADSAVFLPELMALPLRAELVFLSVCQTGTGALLPGEGVMSIATAFAQAGCPRIVAGIWDIPEQASARISRYFYEHLKQEMPPAAALRRAKLDYLREEEGPRLHPYYWAGLVFIGRE
jgi:CHAT domain-containing protein